MKNTPGLIYRLNYVKLNFNKSVRKMAGKKRNFESFEKLVSFNKKKSYMIYCVLKKMGDV